MRIKRLNTFLLVIFLFLLNGSAMVVRHADLHYFKEKDIKVKNTETGQYIIFKKDLFYGGKPFLELALGKSRLPLSSVALEDYPDFLKKIVSKDEVVYHFKISAEDFKEVTFVLFDKNTVFTFVKLSELIDYGKRYEKAKKEGNEIVLPPKPEPKKGTLEELEKRLNEEEKKKK